MLLLSPPSSPPRDPILPINRSEITRFPHAVLEVKLSLGQGQSSPAWVQVREGGRHRGECGGRGAGTNIQVLAGLQG